MINVSINVDTSRLRKFAADYPVMVAQVQTRVLAYAGQAIASRATMAFRTPSFRPAQWAPRKQLGDGHPLLIRSGLLRTSIDWRFLRDDAVIVGSSHKYSIYHQYGTKKMPARPFFPFDANNRLAPAMERKIERETARIVADELGSVINH